MPCLQVAPPDYSSTAANRHSGYFIRNKLEAFCSRWGQICNRTLMPRIPRMISGASVCVPRIKTNAFVLIVRFLSVSSTQKPAENNTSRDVTQLQRPSSPPPFLTHPSSVNHLRRPAPRQQNNASPTSFIAVPDCGDHDLLRLNSIFPSILLQYCPHYSRPRKPRQGKINARAFVANPRTSRRKFKA